MKSIHVFLLLFLLMGVCSSCSTTFWVGFPNEQLMKIQKGMTREEVKKVFGDPVFRRFDADAEEWEYRKIASNGWSVAVIRFVGNEVTGLNTFYEAPFVPVKSQEPVKLEKSPHKQP